MSGALPYFGDAYMADTRHLTLEEHGAYHLLLLVAWRSSNCALPDDDKRICQMLGITPKKWASLKPTVMAFWTRTKNGWEQKRLTKERRWVDEKRGRQSGRAKERWADGETPGRTRAQRLSDARAKGRHTEAQWQALVDAVGGKCVKCGAVDKLCKDHIIPLYQGGSDAIGNIQPLCQPCNSSKGPDTTDYRLSACKDLFERLPECLPDASQMPSGTPAPPPPPTSVDKSTAGKPAAIDPDPVKELFDLGISILTSGGYDEKKARSLIGKWRQGGKRDAEVLVALLECRTKLISEPVEWLSKRLQPAQFVSKSGYEYRGDLDQVIKEADKRGDMETYWSAKAEMRERGQGKEKPKQPSRRGRGGMKPIGLFAADMMRNKS